MKIQFIYDQDYDIQNYITASKSVENILQGYQPDHREVDVLKGYGNKLRSRLNSVLLTTA